MNECKATGKTAWEATIINGFKTLGDLQEEKLFCDLTLRSKDGAEFKVHKIIMYSVSGFFKDLFSIDFKDSSTNIVQLDSCTGDALAIVISFVYRGELNLRDVGPEDLIKVINVARYLQMKELLEVCIFHVGKLINDETCINCWRLAQEYSMENIEQMCISHVVDFSQRLFEDFSFFSNLTEAEMKRLLQDKNLECEAEIIFKMLVKWAHNKTNSSDEFLKLFSTLVDFVQFSSLSKDFLLSNVLHNEDLMKNNKVLTKFAEFMRDKWDECEELEGNPQFTSHWKKQFLAIRGTDVFSVCPVEGRVEKVQKNIHNYADFGYTTVDNSFLLVCGGKLRKYTPQESCKYFSSFTKKWMDLRSMPLARCGHRCAYIDGKIYVCGGLTNNGVTGTTSVLDLNTERWMAGKDMQYTRNLFGLTVQSGSLYATGGRQFFNGIEMYDPRTSNGWEMLCTDFQTSDFTQCVSIGFDIYCFNDSKKFSIYDTRMKKSRLWTLASTTLYTNVWDSFHVCELNGEIGILLPSGYKFFKLNLKGEITSNITLPITLQSNLISALVAMYY